MSLRPPAIGHAVPALPLVLPRDALDAHVGHLVALPHPLDQVVEENPQSLLFLLVAPLLSRQQPFHDRDRGHPPSVIDLEGFAAEVQVPVTALIPVTIAG